VQVFKSIYRLDFPLSFALIDNLGKYAEILHEKTGAVPFERQNTNVNLVEHRVASQVVVGKDVARFNLSLNSFDFVVEYRDGLSLGNAHKHPTVELATELARNLQAAPTNKIQRLGIRHWILIQDPKFTYTHLRNALVSQLELVKRAVEASFPTVEDVAATFEASAKDGTQARTSLGPYREAERERYFSLPNEIEEALIVDIDVWQAKLEIPALSLEAVAKSYERMSRRVVDKLVHELLEQVE
jgi:hypothetical protein